MAQMTLLPDGVTGHTSHWVANTGTAVNALSHNDGNTAYLACSADGRRIIVTYANPSVHQSAISEITSVRFISVGRSSDRRNPSLVDIQFETPTAGFSETCSYDPHSTSYETINGTTRTTSDGSAAWTYSDLENLSLRCTKSLTQEVALTFLALEVDYVEAQNTTFFGTNF